MPASLLDSQLAALELPDPDEQAVIVDGSATLEEQVVCLLAALPNLGSARPESR
jgi:gluconate kinase